MTDTLIGYVIWTVNTLIGWCGSSHTINTLIGWCGSSHTINTLIGWCGSSHTANTLIRWCGSSNQHTVIIITHAEIKQMVRSPLIYFLLYLVCKQPSIIRWSTLVGNYRPMVYVGRQPLFDGLRWSATIIRWFTLVGNHHEMVGNHHQMVYDGRQPSFDGIRWSGTMIRWFTMVGNHHPLIGFNNIWLFQPNNPSFFDCSNSFCFVSIEFHCSFSISNKILQYLFIIVVLWLCSARQ